MFYGVPAAQSISVADAFAAAATLQPDDDPFSPIHAQRQPPKPWALPAGPLQPGINRSFTLFNGKVFDDDSDLDDEEEDEQRQPPTQATHSITVVNASPAPPMVTQTRSISLAAIAQLAEDDDDDDDDFS